MEKRILHVQESSQVELKLKEYQDMCESLVSKVQEVEAKLVESQQLLVTNQVECNDLINLLTQRQEEITSLQESLSSKDLTLVDSTNQNSVLSNQVSRLESKIFTLEETIQNYTYEMHEIESSRDEVTTELKRSQLLMSEYEDKVYRLSTDLQKQTVARRLAIKEGQNKVKQKSY
jgi:chromosome segregation ATPase